MIYLLADGGLVSAVGPFGVLLGQFIQLNPRIVTILVVYSGEFVLCLRPDRSSLVTALKQVDHLLFDTLDFVAVVGLGGNQVRSV